MTTAELLVSSVHITEDEYNYKGEFMLSGSDKTMNVDLSDMENTAKLQEIKTFFELDDASETIYKTIMEKVMDKAALSSRINEGENYNESSGRKSIEKAAGSLDMA